MIEQYEKVKEAFAENEIDKVWKIFIYKWYNQKDIKELQKVIDKLISVKEKTTGKRANKKKSEKNISSLRELAQLVNDIYTTKKQKQKK